MGEVHNNDKLSEKILFLETRIKHLTNKLRLTREEYESTVRKYYDLYSDMEKKVGARTRELKNLHKILGEKTQQLEIMLDSSPVVIFN